MLKFLKHHWTKREKFFARWGLTHLLIAIVVGGAMAAALLYVSNTQNQGREKDLRQMAQQVQDVSSAPPGTKNIGGPFQLIDQDGKTVTEADYAGKLMLVYFGYTYCPDMCPTGLQSMAHALDQLGPAADKVVPLFITIDPARDTQSKMKEYVAEFHPRIQGLTGTAEQVAKAAAAYQVYYAKGEMVDDHDYVMDHSSLIYLMNAKGGFVTTFPEDADPAAIVRAVQAQMAP